VTILVTGAAGHLGANLVRRLLADGAPVRALLFTPGERVTVEGLDVDHLIGDLRDGDVAARAVQGCRQVYHCAAKVSTTYREKATIFSANVLATRTLLQASLRAGVEKVVVTGSFAATGRRPDQPSTEDDAFNPLEPHSPYDFAKAAVEYECLKAFAEGLPVVIAASTAILGPNDFRPSQMGQVLIRFASRRIPAYVAGGFPLAAARDIVQGHVLAMASGRPGQKYLFDTAYMTFDEIMDLFSEVTGQPRPRWRIPPRLMSFVAGVTEAVMPYLRPDAEQLLTPAAIRLLTMNRRVDITKAVSELGYRPTSVKTAISEAYEWFVARGMIRPGRRPSRPDA
jgi:nucleoside-diphosphate-sugar epimerase